MGSRTRVGPNILQLPEYFHTPGYVHNSVYDINIMYLLLHTIITLRYENKNRKS